MPVEQPTSEQPAVVGEFIGQISFYQQPDGRIAAMPDLENISDTNQLRIQAILSGYVNAIAKRFLDKALQADALKKDQNNESI